jgi:GNAT superfamily N-acetyltransferase
MAVRRFAPIDLQRHARLCIEFRRDAYQLTTGSATEFDKDWGGDGERYLDWLALRLREFPEGMVHLLEDDRPIGQIESSLHPDGLTGYVVLFYLDAAHRHTGLGELLLEHAAAVFVAAGRRRMRLTCAERNKPAMAFMLRQGFVDQGPSAGREGLRVFERDLDPAAHPQGGAGLGGPSSDDAGPGLEGWPILLRGWRRR